MSAKTGRRIEIEITPMMIEAGKRELARFNGDIAPLSEGVERILSAALEANGFKVLGEWDD